MKNLWDVRLIVESPIGIVSRSFIIQQDISNPVVPMNGDRFEMTEPDNNYISGHVIGREFEYPCGDRRGEVCIRIKASCR